MVAEKKAVNFTEGKLFFKIVWFVLPIVATNVGGVPDMLKNEESALLTEVDSENIAGAFLDLAQDEERRKRLGEQAKARAKEYSAEKMAKGYLEIYQK